MVNLDKIASDRPILIAGPTGCGKSELAMRLAGRHGGVIINADAMQVFADWRILTARPSAQDQASVRHHLYGHVPGHTAYSVGQWLRDIAPLLDGPQPAIIVGGTGLYFAALTQGLADIPLTPPDIRALANRRLATEGAGALLAELDAASARRIDAKNPMRVQRAWEVLQSTGQGLAAWQDQTPPPILPPDRCESLLMVADTAWLNTRISSRFDAMLAAGALDEARQNRPTWSPERPSAKVIGAAQLMAHLDGQMSLDQVRDTVTIATRQFAKRQRSWFRARMKHWQEVRLP